MGSEMCIRDSFSPPPIKNSLHTSKPASPHSNTPSSSSHLHPSYNSPSSIFSSTPTTQQSTYFTTTHSLPFTFLQPTSFYYLHNSSIPPIRHYSIDQVHVQESRVGFATRQNHTSQNRRETPENLCARSIVHSTNHVGLCYRILHSSRVNCQFLNPSR